MAGERLKMVFWALGLIGATVVMFVAALTAIVIRGVWQ